MNWKKRSASLLNFMIVGSSVSMIAIATMWWAIPVHERTVVVLIQSRYQRGPAAHSYVRTAPDNEQLASLMTSNTQLRQLTIPALKHNPQVWLRKHLSVRGIRDDRIEITARARTIEVSRAETDVLIAIASEVLIADAGRIGLGATTLSVVRSGG